jgi:hypothetical protein
MLSARTRPTRQPSRPAQDRFTPPPAPSGPDPAYLAGKIFGQMVPDDSCAEAAFILGMLSGLRDRRR